MKKSLFGSLLGFFLVVGLSFALSANPNDPKKTEAAKGCCSSKAKTEQAGCPSTEKKGCADDKKGQAACGEKKVEKASTENNAEKTTATVRRGCCSEKK